MTLPRSRCSPVKPQVYQRGLLPTNRISPNHASRNNPKREFLFFRDVTRIFTIFEELFSFNKGHSLFSPSQPHTLNQAYCYYLRDGCITAFILDRLHQARCDRTKDPRGNSRKTQRISSLLKICSCRRHLLRSHSWWPHTC